MDPTEGKFAKYFDLRNLSTKPPYYREVSRVAQTYAVLFTPRSGSTWLTHEISSYVVLSHPDEYFNLHTFEDSLALNKSNNIYEYYDSVANKRVSPAGVFGFQISYFDLAELEKLAGLRSLMTGRQVFFYLRRNNFIAQAVSLYFAEQTNVFHSSKNEKISIRRDVQYDKERIKFWARHILQQEYGIESWLSTNYVTSLWLTYEEFVVDIRKAVCSIADALYCVIPRRRIIELEIPVKLLDCRKIAFEALFRKDEKEFCAKWECRRGRYPCVE